ncbi:MAG: BadF/BadG/BcrA/BcrD ATPase family protein [Rhodoglobus sp.]
MTGGPTRHSPDDAPASAGGGVGMVVAVDGGGSKTDVVALTRDGTIVGRARGATTSPHLVGLAPAIALVDSLVREATDGAAVEQANVYVSGLDLPYEVEAFAASVAAFDWASDSTVVENDLYALLRAGTSATDAVAVVCGTGINAIGIRSDGATARFAALGMISGDWGGGSGLGESALWHAARAADGRGPATTLSTLVPTSLGLPSVEAVIHALHFGTLDNASLTDLPPVIFEAANAGDAVAASIVDRLAEEIALMAASCIDRLELDRAEIPVVLGGGVLRGRDARLLAGVESLLAVRAPLARITLVTALPIVGAALLALESAGATAEAVERARVELEK